MNASELSLTVESIDQLSQDVRRIHLMSDGILPDFTPGSHIGVEWTPGLHNFYSLTGRSLAPSRYSVAVRLEPQGRGGSLFMHQLSEGDRLEATLPRSSFAPVLSARKHLYVAGGIGVTPILAHLHAAKQWTRSAEVFYASRDDTFGAELDALCSAVQHSPSRADLWRRLRPALTSQPLGTHLYVCGPLDMIDAVRGAALAAGWLPQRIHSEPFSSGHHDPGHPFSVVLKDSSRIEVGADTSLLQALLDNGITVSNLCRQGVCGECRLAVRGGTIDHRDLVLSDSEKAEGRSIMACVSRADGELELEL